MPTSFGALVYGPGRLSWFAHITKKQTEIQEKYFISAPRETVPLAPRHSQAQDPNKKHFQLSHS